MARIAYSLKAYARHASDSALLAGQAADSAAREAQNAAVAEGQGAIRKLGVTALAVKGISIWIGTTGGLYEYKEHNREAAHRLGLKGRLVHVEARLRDAGRAGYGESLRGMLGEDPLA